MFLLYIFIKEKNTYIYVNSKCIVSIDSFKCLYIEVFNRLKTLNIQKHYDKDESLKKLVILIHFHISLKAAFILLNDSFVFS